MKKKNNPFLLKGYVSKELFCDREKELEQLFTNVKNGIDTTLISPRRMGKTGLVFRFFDHLRENGNIRSIYVDIFSSRNLSEFIKLLAEAILLEFPEKTPVGNQFLDFIKGFRPLIGFDPLSGQPQIQINYQSAHEKENTLQGLFNFLENQGEQIVIAIDEFQQISDYPEKNTEALLRTYIQKLTNIRFIFCGSRKAMMINLFSNVKRPFFASTQYLSLEKIDREVYSSFIRNKFSESEILITDEALTMVMDWSLIHTFYTQSLCNILFYIAESQITIDTVKVACVELLKRNEPVFYQYRQLLTTAQWNFLIAIAKEGEVNQLTAQKFISQYEIGTPANARRISKSLLEKELLLELPSKKETSYRVYDVFLSRWLENEY
ncbi:MAG: archaeal ATPase family [Prolixibacteraceae bacterium]|nr:MAG: archaeal ATPase family [Prolixibacteraceae bacterium]